MQTVCTPAIVYGVVALIATLIVLIFNYYFGRFVLSLCSIIAFMLILMGVCNIEPNISWFITIAFILMTLSVSVTTIVRKTEEIIDRNG